MSLKGKVAIVTGASRGIGAKTAELFAAEGAMVVICARTLVEGTARLEGSLATTRDKILEQGGTVVAIAADLGIYEECKKVYDFAKESFGHPVDILVNNAALTYFEPVAKFRRDKWLKSTSVNCHGPFYMSQLCLQDMSKTNTQSAICNISSSAAIGPGRGPYKNGEEYGNSVLYGAEKAFLERFTQGLAAEVYKNNVSVTCVSPSQIVPTPGVVYHKLLHGQPMESEMTMARSILLLCTESLDRITGRVCYSQEILKEFGKKLWKEDSNIPGGIGIDVPGSGYSKI